MAKGSWFSRYRTWVFAAPGIVAAVICGWFAFAALIRPHTLDFTIIAESGAVTLRTHCGPSLVWDLPPGTIRAGDAFELPSDLPVEGKVDRAAPPRTDAAPVTAVLEGDVTATLRLTPEGKLSIVFASSGPGGRLETSDRDLRIEGTAYYDSASAAGSESDPLEPFALLLTGRVIVGDDVPQGSGIASDRLAPGVLTSGSVTGRTAIVSDRFVETAPPRKTLLEEPLDPGDLVDTHPELGAMNLLSQSANAVCGDRLASAARWPAIGFVSPGENGLKIVLHRHTAKIAVSHLGAAPFELNTPLWSRVVASPATQIGVAVVALATALVGFLASLFTVVQMACDWWRKKRSAS